MGDVIVRIIIGVTQLLFNILHYGGRLCSSLLGTRVQLSSRGSQTRDRKTDTVFVIGFEWANIRMEWVLYTPAKRRTPALLTYPGVALRISYSNVCEHPMKNTDS